MASATTQALQDKEEVTLVAMNAPREYQEKEDLTAVLYLEALMYGEHALDERVLDMARTNDTAAILGTEDPGQPTETQECCAAIDTFDFRIKIHRQNWQLIAGPLHHSMLRS